MNIINKNQPKKQTLTKIKADFRPNVSAEPLRELEFWIKKSLNVHSTSYGEFTSQLYTDYISYLEHKYGEDPKQLVQKKISRKLFAQALVYVCQSKLNADFVREVPGRPPYIFGVEPLTRIEDS